MRLRPAVPIGQDDVRESALQRLWAMASENV